MAVCRGCHDKMHDHTLKKVDIFKAHKTFMLENNVKFDEDYIDKKIEQWS